MKQLIGSSDREPQPGGRPRLTDSLPRARLPLHVDAHVQVARGLALNAQRHLDLRQPGARTLMTQAMRVKAQPLAGIGTGTEAL